MGNHNQQYLIIEDFLNHSKDNKIPEIIFLAALQFFWMRYNYNIKTLGHQRFNATITLTEALCSLFSDFTPKLEQKALYLSRRSEFLGGLGYRKVARALFKARESLNGGKKPLSEIATPSIDLYLPVRFNIFNSLVP